MGAREMNAKDAPLYLLYSGQSVDGMGAPEYTGRTDDISVAYKHWLECEKPYSTGKVVRITDTTQTTMMAAHWNRA